jgi:hypothetical protein
VNAEDTFDEIIKLVGQESIDRSDNGFCAKPEVELPHA